MRYFFLESIYSPSYGVLFHRYTRACSSNESWIFYFKKYTTFQYASQKEYWYVMERSETSLRKFYGRYEDPIQQYEVSISRVWNEILENEHIRWHPPSFGHNTN